MSTLVEVLRRYLLYRPFTIRDLVDPPPVVAGPFPEPWRTEFQSVTGPHPEPWLLHVSKLVGAVSVRVAAQQVQDPELREKILKQAETAIGNALDEPELCPRPPRRPWPGPNPNALEVIQELVLFASTMPEGPIRQGLLELSGQIAERSFNA